jgi:hypothetical protein
VLFNLFTMKSLKNVPVRFVISVYQPICEYVTTGEPLRGFSLNFIMGEF